MRGGTKIVLLVCSFLCLLLALSILTERKVETGKAAPSASRTLEWATLLDKDFFAAVEAGRTDEVRYLLERGARVNGRNPWGQTALCCAVKNGCRDVAGLLMERGANPNVIDGLHKWRPLKFAIAMRDEKLIALLRQHGATE